MSTLPCLGAGLGYRAPLREQIWAHAESIDWLEIIAEHFIDPTPEQLDELKRLRARFRCVPHSIGLSLGHGLERRQLARLERLLRVLEPPWWSEHIAFTRAGEISIGHLTPVPFTHAALNALVDNIRAVKRAIGVPLIVENIAYLFEVPGAQMSEVQMLGEVLERADVGLLLDVTNLHANATNHGYDPLAFLDALPASRIVQLHIVGGHDEEGLVIDSHSAPTPEPVWALLDEVLRRADVRAIALERDADFPPIDALLGELRRAESAARAAGRWS